MKINNFPLDQTFVVTNSLQGKPGNTVSPAAGDIPQTAVQYMFDNQVRIILNQLVKMLSQQTATLLELPASLADEARQILREPLAGDQVVARGLAAMLRGQKTVSQSLAAFANTVGDAAVIKEQFPDGLPRTLSALIAKFEDQIGHLDPDIGKALLALATELTENPAPVTDASAVLQQAGRRLIDSLPREEYTIPKQQFQARLPVLLETLVENFQQELAQLPFPPLEQEILTASLRQICQQLQQELTQPSPSAAAKGQPPSFVGLPAVIDDIIDHFENQLVKLDATFEKDVMVTNLRQVLSQLTQDLEDGDKAALSRLADYLLERAPEKIRTAAGLHNLPELKEIWVLQRMSASREWLELPAAVLRQAGQNLKDMNTVIPRNTDQSPDSSPAKTSFNLAVPLYFGEEKKAYPAYIHIFQDREKSPRTAILRLRPGCGCACPPRISVWST